MGLASGEGKGRAIVRTGARGLLPALILCLLLVGCMDFDEVFDEFEESEEEWTAEWDDPPYVVSFQPAESALVASVPEISARFSEEIAPETVNAQTFTLVDSFSRRILGEVTCQDRKAFFTPASLLGSGRYTAAIDGVEDLAGKSLGYVAWSFTVDSDPPSVYYHDPAAEAKGVSLFPTITVEFSEEIASSTLGPSTFLLADLSGNPVPGRISSYGLSASFTPLGSLDSGTSYRVTLTAAVRDLAGNPLPEPFSWTFMTMAGGTDSFQPTWP